MLAVGCSAAPPGRASVPASPNLPLFPRILGLAGTLALPGRQWETSNIQHRTSNVARSRICQCLRQQFWTTPRNRLYGSLLRLLEALRLHMQDPDF